MLDKAGEDLKFLLDRGYRKDSALSFVGDHYHLTNKERNRLMREIHSEEEIGLTESKLRPLSGIEGQSLAIDGFNVLITVEAGLSGGEVFKCQDCMLRDNAMAFSNYKIKDETKKAADSVLEALAENSPARTTWVFDSQISRSGKLAEYVLKRMGELKLRGESMTCPAADNKLVRMNILTATSDTALIRRLDSIVDLPSAVVVF